MTAVTSADGKFEVTSVPPGTYVVVYGLFEEVEGNPQAWDELSVHYHSPVLDLTGKTIDPFGGKKGVRISDESTVDITSHGISVNTGFITSAEFGLSIEYRQHEPLTVSLTPGQTAQVTLDISGR